MFEQEARNEQGRESTSVGVGKLDESFLQLSLCTRRWSGEECKFLGASTREETCEEQFPLFSSCVSLPSYAPFQLVLYITPAPATQFFDCTPMMRESWYYPACQKSKNSPRGHLSRLRFKFDESAWELAIKLDSHRPSFSFDLGAHPDYTQQVSTINPPILLSYHKMPISPGARGSGGVSLSEGIFFRFIHEYRIPYSH